MPLPFRLILVLAFPDIITFELFPPNLRLLLQLTLPGGFSFTFVVTSLAPRGLPTFHVHDLTLRITCLFRSGFPLGESQEQAKSRLI